MGNKGEIIGGRYELIRLIGEGGMGKVYEARHVQIGRKVAIKVLHKDFASNRDVLERFHREASIAGNLGHANIVEVMDFGISAEGLPYIVMEFLEGRSLADILKNEGFLEASRATEIMKQVLFALSEAHLKQIIHRDLKPENVFIADIKGRGHEVKILDFGISKMMKERPADRLTKTGSIMGTPYYMSPEQIKGIDVDLRTDIYACGVILYESVTGQVPFVGNTYNEIIIKATTEPPPNPKRFNKKLPDYLISIILKAMEKDPARRFQNVDEFMDALLDIDGVKLEELPVDVDEEGTLPDFSGDEPTMKRQFSKDEVRLLVEIAKKRRSRITGAASAYQTEDTTMTKLEREEAEAAEGRKAALHGSKIEPAGTPLYTESKLIGPPASKRMPKILLAGASLAFLALIILIAAVVSSNLENGGSEVVDPGAAAPASATPQQAHEQLTDTVTLTMTDYPTGAVVKFGDQVEPAGQIQLAKGSKPLTLTISAEGFLEQSFMIVPDRDQFLEVFLVPVEVPLEKTSEQVPHEDKTGGKEKTGLAIKKEYEVEKEEKSIKKKFSDEDKTSTEPEQLPGKSKIFTDIDYNTPSQIIEPEEDDKKTKKEKTEKKSGVDKKENSKFKWDYE